MLCPLDLPGDVQDTAGLAGRSRKALPVVATGASPVKAAFKDPLSAIISFQNLAGQRGVVKQLHYHLSVRTTELIKASIYHSMKFILPIDCKLRFNTNQPASA
jgi:diadenosine tetraphosphate (Ap4A) HIT family hydrolase